MTITGDLNVVKSEPRHVSLDFMLRIAAFFNTQMQSDCRLSRVWETVQGDAQKPIITALLRNITEAEGMISELYNSNMQFGLDSPSPYCYQSPREYADSIYIDSCKRLVLHAANSFGGIAFENPEQQSVPLSISMEQCIKAIESGLGTALTHPGWGCCAGMIIGGRFITQKLLDAACMASILMLQDAWNDAGCRILEIGAGIGWLAYLMDRLGQVEYHTIDLVAPSVFHAHMLASCTSESRISFASEHIASTFTIHGLSPMHSSVDMVVNENSFPEIRQDVQREYMATIETCLVPGGVFVSVNHECELEEQHRTFEVFSGNQKFKLIQRSPYIARQGYMVEVWRRQ